MTGKNLDWGKNSSKPWKYTNCWSNSASPIVWSPLSRDRFFYFDWCASIMSAIFLCIEQGSEGPQNSADWSIVSSLSNLLWNNHNSDFIQQGHFRSCYEKSFWPDLPSPFRYVGIFSEKNSWKRLIYFHRGFTNFLVRFSFSSDIIFSF